MNQKTFLVENTFQVNRFLQSKTESMNQVWKLWEVNYNQQSSIARTIWIIWWWVQMKNPALQVNIDLQEDLLFLFIQDKHLQLWRVCKFKEEVHLSQQIEFKIVFQTLAVTHKQWNQLIKVKANFQTFIDLLILVNAKTQNQQAGKNKVSSKSMEAILSKGADCLEYQVKVLVRKVLYWNLLLSKKKKITSRKCPQQDLTQMFMNLSTIIQSQSLADNLSVQTKFLPHSKRSLKPSQSWIMNKFQNSQNVRFNKTSLILNLNKQMVSK